MFILDTDHMSLLEWDSNSAAHLRERLSDCEPHEVVTTIVNYEEQIRGWMAYLAGARTIDAQVEAYRRLRNHLDNYRQVPVLDLIRPRRRSISVCVVREHVLGPWT